jgi:hypothetical protein
MAAIQGRQHRSGVSGTVELRARVQPDNFGKAHAAAAALGISMAAYVDALLSREELDERGRPRWWTAPAPTDQIELLQETPLKSA